MNKTMEAWESVKGFIEIAFALCLIGIVLISFLGLMSFAFTAGWQTITTAISFLWGIAQ